ncbi:MAG: histidine phosphatase family protein [Candidatus Berkelbacteria bacterium]
MKIFLARHGQTTGDIEGRFGGDYDDCLTDLGENQAVELAGKLKGKSIGKIYYSPRIRATQTAHIVAQNTNIPIEKNDELRERNAYGILTGQLIEEAKATHPELIEELKNPKATIEGAEVYDIFKQRVASVFSQLTNSNLNTIGIITHGGVISCFLREIIGRERKTLHDCAIIELNYDNGKYEIISLDGVELE